MCEQVRGVRSHCICGLGLEDHIVRVGLGLRNMGSHCMGVGVHCLILVSDVLISVFLKFPIPTWVGEITEKRDH